jgi:DNA mismatch endonuclease, patch repair protein
MSDRVDKARLSWHMAQIRSKGNKSTELKVVSLFRQHGITGWRRHWPVAGRPDFAFPKVKIAMFVDGCFWHGHNCRLFRHSQNADYWKTKIERNKKRDRRVNKTLRAAGWSVIRVWECHLKNPERIMRRISRFLAR